MPTWGQLLAELQEEFKKSGPVAVDKIRRKYLAQLADYTQRATILYSTRWTDPPPNVGPVIMITEEDVQAMMEVVHGQKSRKLDLVLHSPGGSAEATEAIVHYLRSKFDDIRVIVPQAAMSAATMLSCSADVIVMGRHSSLGPIDPQINGIYPAQAILDQFDLAKKECQDPRLLAAWAPMLQRYGPALLVQCRNALDLSEELVGRWLGEYMLKGQPDKAKEIAHWLADHRNFKTHGRHISREVAREKGLIVEDLEKDSKLQDAVLSVFHATTHTLSATPAVKIVENQLGRAFIKQFEMIQIPAPGPTGPPNPPPKQA